jgi:uncharacterized protein YndB with AHSA1/START domain/ketosteroid isomerase-like protein
MTTRDTAAVVRAYYDAWTGGDFGRAAALLAPGLTVEVPVNEYPDAGSFAAALKSFGSLATRTELLAAMSAGQQGMLLYDMDVPGLSTLRVAEHLTVDDGQITRIRQIHDTAALRAAGFVGDVASPAGGYARRLVINAPRERVFEAIATVDGPRHWWTADVTGSADVGADLRFGFAGLDEQMVMRVSACRRPATVRWSCTEHTRDGEWAGTLLQFDLTARGPGTCELEFRHTGLPAEAVAPGWEHFLASLAAYAETGAGTPFGT